MLSTFLTSTRPKSRTCFTLCKHSLAPTSSTLPLLHPITHPRYKSSATAGALSKPVPFSHTTDATSTRPHNAFEDTATAFANIPTWHVLRAWFVLKLCTLTPLVNNAEALLAFSRNVFGDALVRIVVKPIFFNHFCAGEDERELEPKVAFLAKNGIGAILDFAAEADITSTSGNEEVEKHRKGVESARVYDYITEDQCDANAEQFKAEIHAVHNVSSEGFAAVKVTALGNPLLLKRWSQSLVEIRNLFTELDANHDGRLLWSEFEQGYRRLFTPTSQGELRELFERFRDHPQHDYIDAVSWTTKLRVQDVATLANRCLTPGPFQAASLSEEELALMEKMEARIRSLATLANKLDVRLMIDAEHSYFQPAIDNIVLNLQREFNTKQAIVFNTYQCYLKEAPTKLSEHISMSEREGFAFACKLVRGAYMDLERRHAVEVGQESPIHNIVKETHACFNKAVTTVLRRSAVRSRKEAANLLVATHNQKSIEHTLEEMEKHNVDRADVYFGQLLGMADHLTFTLGINGYKAYKYVPYGPLVEVLPYLVRRAQENSAIMQGAQMERALLAQELKQRLLSKVFIS